MDSLPHLETQIALSKDEAIKVIHILVDLCEASHMAKIINVLYGPDNAMAVKDGIVVTHLAASQALRAVLQKVK